MIRGGPREFLTAAPIHWEIGRKRSGLWVTVPKGFAFESSVPRLLRWFLSPDDPDFLLAAAVHDYLLERGFARAFAAGEWHAAALKAGAPRWKAGLAFVCVAVWAVVPPPRPIFF